MTKRKLERFAEMKDMHCVVQPPFDEIWEKDYALKGKWNEEFFKRNRKLVVEIGCGKGEYSIGLAERFPEKNYLGIDIKGARLWRGCKNIIQKDLKNVGFLRTRVEFCKWIFGRNEIDEIWITFPDPQPKKSLKRLSSSRFLNMYRNFLTDGGIVHLKTDHTPMHYYTRELLEINGIEPEVATDDLYQSGLADDILSIRTFYEEQFLEQGKKITYLKFRLPHHKELIEPADPDYK